MKTKKALITLLTVTVALALILPGSLHAFAKSMYVIANINSSPSPINAYDIGIDGKLTYQATYGVPYHGWGAVGISVDSDNAILFVTYEMSNTIQLVDGTTMLGIGTTTAPGASNLAGIAYDHDNQKIYTVDRYTKILYSYSWDPSTTTLTLDSGFPKTLTELTEAYGIALDEGNDWLFIADETTSIKYYNTGDWSLAGTILVSHYATEVAVDAKNGYVYSGHWTSASGPSSHLLSKYDMGTDTETTLDITTLPGIYSYEDVFGLAVDQDSGIIYATTGYSSDRLLVFDSDLTLLQDVGDIGDPTGLCVPTEEVAYNPLSLSKDDGLAVDECVPRGGTITYTISYDNSRNDFAVNNVVLVDYLPADTTFVSASDSGVYDSGDHKVTWNLGTLPAEAPLDSVTLVVTIDMTATPGGTLDNAATIDSDETPPTTKHEFTTVCELEPTIESSDSDGNKKDEFDWKDDVYVYGSDYLPSSTFDLYIVEDVAAWTDGMVIPSRVVGTASTVDSDAGGDIPVTMVWSASLTVGEYDIVVDVNGNGLYDKGVDALDDMDVDLAGFFVIPELPFGTILGLISCIAAFGFTKIRRRN